MVPFASISLGMGALSWLIPRKVFSAVDNLLYSSYMRACLFVFENVASTKINFYGDIEAVSAKRESAIVLSNHQSNVDWVVITMIANRQQGNECGLRFMIKYAMHYFPLFGWYTYQHGYVYVRRFGSVMWSAVERQLSFLKSLNEPFWLLIFPEGTRFSPKKRDIIESSKRFCERIQIPVFENVLTPRTSGFVLSMRHLRESVDAVYDITLAYDQSKEVGREKCAPNMFEFVCGVNSKRTLHIHIRRFPVNELPEDVDALKEWLMQRYLIKNGMLEAFYNGDGLPDLAVIDAPRTPFSVTVPPSLFFAFALIAPFFSTTVRKIYLVTICSSPALILWLRLRGCV
ncbi:1-acyl-sn-glycerol-3-phosphate acyltransferase epsilon [Toxocara canis]|uniref:1-acyl-sn-glycerol-3-phosphate acyltransferase epsilon n=1 Tax=Toxocara canis TaxID=6265 RepID=A0A0B2UI63_TOXCA|nr:1-acyl-sn-glycerol-3-phosphate acyltransferase epsilon [Toxocara canis]